MKHLSSGLRVGLAMAVCAAMLSPSALADNGKKPPGEGPGNSANAPGHEKRDEVPPPQPAAPVQPREPSSAEPAAPAAGNPAAAKEAEPTAPAAVPAQPAKPGRPKGVQAANPEQAKPEKTKPESQPRSGAVPRPPSARDRAAESTARSKALICHATGSATNPYVLISISVSAWGRGSGHGAHADDVFVDWSWPGDPRQKNDAFCPQTGPVGTTTGTTTTTSTGTTPSSSSGPPAPDAAGDDSVQTASTPPAADGEQLGPTLAPPIARAVERPARDVLTSGARVAGTAVRGTLPFTGLPVWAVALLGWGLVTLGVVLQRRPRA